MNIRQVLKAFTALRQLTDDESALLETLRGLNDAERESLVLALQPEKTATKRASKKSNKSASKSRRASGMAAAINRSLSQQRRVAICAAMVDDNGGEMPCGEVEGNPIHDSTMGYAGYHEFQSAPVAHEAVAGG